MGELIRRRSLISGGSELGDYIFYNSSGVDLQLKKSADVIGNTNIYYWSDDKGINKYYVGGVIFYDNLTEDSNGDRWYVYDTAGLTSNLYWGYYGTSCGTSDGIGKGKTNTQTVLNKGVPTDYTPNVWSFIKGKRDANYNGCNDWFIASKAEQDQLRSSGLVNWYSSKYVWSSVEYDANGAYFWRYNYSRWSNDFKYDTLNGFAVRAFGSTDATSKQQTIPVVKGFGACSWAEISRICDLGLADDYISNGTRAIGDVNTTVNYGGQTGGIQLVHVLTDEQRGSSYYNTSGHIVVQFVNTIATSQYRTNSSDPQKYFESNLHTACNTTIYNALDSALKPYLKQWNCIVGKENTTMSAITETYNQMVYLAAPTAKEVGSSNEYNSTENSSTFTFSYYSTDVRRIKSGASSYWWFRSPSRSGSASSYNAYYVDNHAVVLGNKSVDNTYGVAPIGVI